MKQSSIEWLYSNNETICEMLLLNKIPESTYEQLINCFSMNLEQAKAMHKEELLDTWEDSRIEYMGDDYIGKIKSFDDYYNETFNTK